MIFFRANSFCAKHFAFLGISLLGIGILGCAPQNQGFTLAPDLGFPTLGATQEVQRQANQLDSSNSSSLPNQTQWPDLGGYWLMDHITYLHTQLPVIEEEVETQIHARFLVEIRQNDNQLHLYETLCDVFMTSTPDYNQTRLSDEFINASALQHRQIQLIKQDDLIFSESDEVVSLRGVYLDDPKEEALPSDRSDVRVVDGDGDGYPGLTANLVGFPEGNVYLVQRTIDRLKGQVINTDQLAGEIIWTDEQKFLGASNEVLLIEVQRWVPQEPNKHSFNLSRVDYSRCPARSLAQEKVTQSL